ncbi:FtsX-like permease family protein [Pediococcus acidilactici]
MIKIGIKEFRYQLNTWLGALVVFIAASVITSCCLIIYFSMIAAKLDNNIIKAISITPLSFGLVTLSVVISGIIVTVGKAFAKEHAQLTQLGATPAQLAQITAIEMVLVSFLGTFSGYFVALPLAQSLYHSFQREAGKQYFPLISVNYHLSALFTVLGITLLIAYVSSFLYSYHYQMKMKTSKKRHWLKIWKIILQITTASSVFLGILWEYYQIYFPAKNVNLVNTLQNILILTAVLIWLIGKYLINFSLYLIYRGLDHFNFRTLTTAFYRIKNQPSRLSNLIKPILITLLFLSGIIHLILELLNMQRVRTPIAIFLTLLIYLGPTLIIVAGNMISLTIMEKNVAKQDFIQLKILGYSPRDLFFEQLQEGLLYSLTISFLMGGFNLIFFATVRYIKTKIFGVAYFSVNWSFILYWPFLAGLLSFILIFLIGSIRPKLN